MAIIIEYLFIFCYNINMFNWFKRKVELKNEDSIMSSTYVKHGVKVGSEIIVPNNFKCLVYNNGKYYFSLDSGKHKVSNDKFEPLILAQSKTRRKKYVKMVCHYINLNPQTITIKYKKQNYIVKFNVSDTIDFANLLLLYTFKVDGDYATNTINDVFVEGLTWLNGDYSKFDAEFFKDYGITISSFKPENKKDSIFNNQDDLLIRNQPQERNTNLAKTQNTLPNIPQEPAQEDKSVPNTEPTENDMPKVKFPECPKCKNVTRFNTTYCLRCGYKLE